MVLATTTTKKIYQLKVTQLEEKEDTPHNLYKRFNNTVFVDYCKPSR